MTEKKWSLFGGNRKVYAVSAIGALVLFLSMFSVVGTYSIHSADEDRDEVFTFARQRLQIYDQYMYNDMSKSLIRLSDKMTEFSRLLEEGSTRLDEYVNDQHLDAIIVMNGNEEVEAQWGTQEDPYADWEEFLSREYITDMYAYPEKEFLKREMVNGEEYDVVVMARKDQPGILLGCTRKSGYDDLTKTSILNALFTNITFPKNGIVVVCNDENTVLCSNEEDSEKVQALLANYTFVPSEDLQSFVCEESEWYGAKYISEEYLIYVFFPSIAVYRTLIVILLAGLLIYVLFWIAFLMYQNYMERQNVEALKKQYRIVDAIGDMYSTMFSVNLFNGKIEVIKVPEAIKDRIKDGMNVSVVLKTFTSEFIQEEYQKGHVEFSDYTSVAERLHYTRNLSYSYKDVKDRWITTSIVPQTWDEEGNVVEALYLTMDITQSKVRELEFNKKLEQTAIEAKRANIAKTDFLRRMSHDIRTPINGIRGMIEIGNHYPEDMQKQKECRDKIERASGFLLDLVNNVLDMNKLESGNVHIEHVPLDLVSMLETLQSVTNVQAETAGVSFTLETQALRHTHVLGSPLHLQQILQNLVSNAIKYTPSKGRVRLCASELEDGKYCFICEDTGLGMSEEFQKKAFEPFSQETNPARSTYTGTGLGLAITKELVEVMHGTVTLKSAPGKGSVFTVILPLDIDTQYTAQTDKNEEEVLAGSLEGKRVLVVEDNEMNMEIIEFLLEKEKIHVDKAWNGQEAVDMFKNSTPGTYDAILMDIMMPVKDGLQATEEIRSMEKEDAKTIPVIAMSANAFHEDAARSRMAGMNAHLTKPVDIAQLHQTLAKFLK